MKGQARRHLLKVSSLGMLSLLLPRAVRAWVAPRMRKAKVIPTLTYQSNDSTGTDSTSNTFSSKTIGAAADNRYVVVAVAWRAVGLKTDPCTVTVAGQACDVLVFKTGGSTNTLAAGIFVTQAPVVSGTTANVVVSAGYSMTRCFIAVYRLTAASRLPNETRDIYLSGSTPQNWNFSSQKTADEVELVVTHGGTASATPTASFSGNISSSFSAINLEYGSFRAGTVTTAGSCTVTTTASSGTVTIQACTAKWGI